MNTVCETAVILGGGNAPDTAAALEAAGRLLGERVGEVTAHSELLCSKPWGFEAEADFVNRAFVVRTRLAAEALLDELQAIEALLGRDREAERREKLSTGQRYASRRIDLDILLYGRHRIDTPRLRVPHPRLLEREFAMAALEGATGWSRRETEENIAEIENNIR